MVYDYRKMVDTEFRDPYLYSLQSSAHSKCLVDSHKLFSHPKSLAVLSNNQS